MIKINNKYRFSNLILLGLFSHVGHVFAQSEAFAPIAYGTFIYDDNVFSLQDDELETNPIEGQADPKDTIVELGAGFRSEITKSSQGFFIEADVYRRSYSTFNNLDFTGGNFNAQWDWFLSKKWDGEISYTFNKEQSNLSDQRLPNGDVYDSNQVMIKAIRNLINNDQIYLSTAFDRKEYELRTSLDNDQTNITLGYKHSTAKDNSVAFELTNSNGKNMSPTTNSMILDTDLNFALNDYDQTSINLVTRWNIGSRDRLDLTVGYASRENGRASNEFDYDGLIYDFRYMWKVGYRTEITGRLGRLIANTENTQILFAVSDLAQIDAKWDASERVQFSTTLRYLELDYTQIIGDRDDQVSSIELKSIYRLNSLINIELSLTDQSRNSSISSNEFDNKQAMLSIIYNPR